VQSTDVYRTIQSGYAELMGLSYESTERRQLRLTPPQARRMATSSRGLPPLHVRRAKEISATLGANATAHGFFGIPIYTNVIQGEWNDDVSQGSCNYAAAVDEARWQSDSTYTDHMYLRDALRPYYAQAFNLTAEQTANMTFSDAYVYADAIYSQRFEQIPQTVDWTPEQIALINTTQIYALLEPYTPKARKLFISKLLETPMRNLKTLATAEDKGEELRKMGPYRLYSAHDTQIANVLQQIDPAFNFTYIKYASNIFFEVYDFPESKAGKDIFVRTVYNG